MIQEPTIPKNASSSFAHSPHNHCESGAITNLFQFYDVQLSEAMIFGIGSGLHFAYFPFIKVLDAPLLTYRYLPGTIFKNAAKSLGITTGMQSFQNKNKAQSALDDHLKKDIPVGLITDMYYLEYMPEMFRFHFNAHNLVVYGKKGSKYCISDSILEMPVMLEGDQLLKARFSKGITGPRGKMYWIEDIPKEIDLKPAIISGIKTVCKRMSKSKFPYGGYKGILKLAEHIENYPKKFKEDRAVFLMLNVVRMQEIVGTGGSGFRYIYANFLKEAAEIFQSKELNDFSIRMVEIADIWRDFALMAGKSAKRNTIPKIESFKATAEFLKKIATMEKTFFTQLNDLNLN